MNAARKVTRRLFMKAVPAAPLAASSLAADVATNAMGVPRGMYSGGAVPANIGHDASYIAERRGQLERLISGKLTEDEKADRVRTDYRDLACHYDGLRSLSPVMRSRFHAAAMQARLEEQERGWATRELRRMLKEWGLS